jgi:hypothetical protein
MSMRCVTALILTSLFLATSGAARAQAIDDFGRFLFNSAALYGSVGIDDFRRSTPGGGTIVGNNPFTHTSYVTGSNYKFGWDTGAEGTLGLRFMQSEAIEARFMKFDSEATYNLRTPGAFIGVGFTGPGNTAYASTYDTNLTSWEVNWRHQLSMFDRLTLIAGVRSINVHDELDATLNGTVAAGDYPYDNKLFGPQIGADLALLPQSSPLQLNVVGKTGRFSLHSAGGIYEYQGANHVLIGTFNTSVSDWVSASEAGISLGYRPSANVSIRASYQVLWIDNIGLASNNASSSLTNPALLNSNVYRGNVIFQGINFGMMISM